MPANTHFDPAGDVKFIFKPKLSDILLDLHLLIAHQGFM